MEREIKRHKLLSVVTLYHPDVDSVARNILTYLHHVDMLIVWDNSPLDEHNEQRLSALLPSTEKISWHCDGCNHCIAKAINFAWHTMQQQGYDLLLVMDEDSSWSEFYAYRTDAERVFDEKPQTGAVAPYVPAVDRRDVNEYAHTLLPIRFFINSGTILSLDSLNAIGGADEDFPLDGLDIDLSIRIQKAGKQLFCLAHHTLTHHLGQPRRCKWLPLGTNDYGVARTYTITKSHVLYLRRHFKWLTWQERWKVIKEVIIYKPVTILLMEEEKLARSKSYIKGLLHGFSN